MKVKKHPHAGKSGGEAEFLKLVNELAGAKRHAEIFGEFLELSYCAIAKTTLPPGEEADNLEERYMRVAGKAGAGFMDAMCRLLAITTMELSSGKGGDFLGRVSGELGALNPHAGQFFTPYDISKLIAQITFSDIGTVIGKQGFFTVHEPASGAGGMILAAAEVIEDLGFSASTQMYVSAIDVSHTAFKMTYLQLALRGIPAVVINGNALSLEEITSRFTPAFFPFFAQHREAFTAWQNSTPAPRSSPDVPARVQLELF